MSVGIDEVELAVDLAYDLPALDDAGVLVSEHIIGDGVYSICNEKSHLGHADQFLSI